MLDIGYWILDIGYWILDVGYWILDIGYWILGVVGCWVWCTHEQRAVQERAEVREEEGVGLRGAQLGCYGCD